MENWHWVAAAIATNGHTRLLSRWCVLAGDIARIRNQSPALVIGQRFWPGMQEIPARVINRYNQVLVSQPAQRQWCQLQEQGWQLLMPGLPHWPTSFAGLDDMPPLLFAQGNTARLGDPALAVVGARHASLEGRRIAQDFSAGLAAAGFVIVSGLALGIDGAAHEGALAQGRTIAVLGQGPGTALYPARHRPLAGQIVEQGGLLLSEFPPGLGPRREFFPQRNRLISGLTQAVIVVEAAIQSGSLITARLSAEQGREVFAVPGSIRNPMSRGCHQLLKEGAHWLEDITDVAQVLKQELFFPAETMPEVSHPLLSFFTSGVNSVEQLQQHSGLELTSLLMQLGELEIVGAVLRVAGGYCRNN